MTDWIAAEIIRIFEPIAQAVIAQKHDAFIKLNRGRPVEMPCQLPLDRHVVVTFGVITQHAFAENPVLAEQIHIAAQLGSPAGEAREQVANSKEAEEATSCL